MVPTFGHCSATNLRLDAVARQNLLEGFPIVAAVGIVRVDAGDPLELALEILDRQQRSHHRFAFIVGRTEHVFRIRHRLLDAVLGGAVPHHQQRLLFFGHRRHTEADAGRDQPVHALDLFLQDQPAKALDGILRRWSLPRTPVRSCGRRCRRPCSCAPRPTAQRGCRIRRRCRPHPSAARSFRSGAACSGRWPAKTPGAPRRRGRPCRQAWKNRDA